MNRCPDDRQPEQAVSQPTEEGQAGSRETAVERSREHMRGRTQHYLPFPHRDYGPLHSNSGGLSNICLRSEKAQPRHGRVHGSSQS